MTRIVIVGVAGRMGHQVATAALQDKDIEVVGGIESSAHPDLGKDMGLLCGQAPIGVLVSDNLAEALRQADTIVEFTNPAASIEHLQIVTQYGKAAVIGTTGFDTAQLEAIRQMSTHVPILLSPNMSIGVNVLLRMVPLIAQALGKDYDIEIIEAHHRHKKDAPSGTALKLGEAIAAALGAEMDKIGVYGRKGIAPRASGEIGIHAVRAGGIVGEHTILFANEGEQIELLHRCYSRQTFALGAIRAAKYIVQQQPGLYSMQDILAAAVAEA
ncbi:MAG: 4-hydroxy-tetrahydrodipicolinate reductase [Chloroflexi bacterium]|nr:4-hydroxy-tetrahydrodipicolinate reductase [Chloroflexota bacterium]